MKSNDILDAIGNVDDEYVKKAKEKQRSVKPVWIMVGTLAACLMLAFIIPNIIINFTCKNNSAPEHNTEKNITMSHTEISVIQIDRWQPAGFLGTVRNGMLIEGKELLTDEEVEVVFSENTTVLLEDGSVFEYNYESPNADECSLPAGSSADIGFQSFQYNVDTNRITVIYAYYVRLSGTEN